MSGSFTSAEVTVYLKARLPGLTIQRGVLAQGRCPFHEHKGGPHSPFLVNLPSGGSWVCTVCGRRGDLEDVEARLAATEAVLRIVGRTPEANQAPPRIAEPAGGEV